MKLDMTTALNKGGFLIPVCNQLHLTLTQTLQKQPFFVKFGAKTNKLNNFTAHLERYFYTHNQLEEEKYK